MSEDIVSYVAIEALNTWGNFSRAYVLSCWRGVRLRSGHRVVINPTFPAPTPDAVIGRAINRYRKPKNQVKPDSSGHYPPRDEPQWFKIKTLLDLSADLQCSNLGAIQIAVSAAPTVFRDLPAFRNFFAHRNRYTLADAASVAAALGLPTNDGPASSLIYRPVTKSVSTLNEWLLDLQDAVHSLCA